MSVLNPIGYTVSSPLQTAMERAIGSKLIAHFQTLKRRYPDRDVSLSGVASQFCQYYESGERIEVAFCDPSGKEYGCKRGTVSITTGWKPAFILMLKSNSRGSSHVLGEHDKPVMKRITRYGLNPRTGKGGLWVDIP